MEEKMLALQERIKKLQGRVRKLEAELEIVRAGMNPGTDGEEEMIFVVESRYGSMMDPYHDIWAVPASRRGMIERYDHLGGNLARYRIYETAAAATAAYSDLLRDSAEG